MTTLHTTYQIRNVLHCIAHIRGDENVKTLFFFSYQRGYYKLDSKVCYIHFEITGNYCNLVGPKPISINDSFHAQNGIISVTSHRWHTILYHFFFGYKMKCICLLITASPANRSNKYGYFLNFVISKWL